MSKCEVNNSYCNISFNANDIGICTDDILWEISDKTEEIFQIMKVQYKVRDLFDGFTFSLDGDYFHTFVYDKTVFASDSSINKIFEDEDLTQKSIRFNIPENSPIYTKVHNYIFSRKLYSSSYTTYEIDWILGIDKVYTNALKLLRKTQSNQLECVIVFYNSSDKDEFVENNPELIY